jgi:DNA-binding NtrC family response regulator
VRLHPVLLLRRTSAGSTSALAAKVEALERREIEDALKKFSGNRTHAADALGLSRQGLLKKMDRFGLS